MDGCPVPHHSTGPRLKCSCSTWCDVGGTANPTHIHGRIRCSPYSIGWRRFHRRFTDSIWSRVYSHLCSILSARRVESTRISIPSPSAHPARYRAPSHLPTPRVRYRAFARTHRQFTTVHVSRFLVGPLSDLFIHPFNRPTFLLQTNFLHLLPIYLIKEKHPK
jgi:hypothetical protein